MSVGHGQHDRHPARRGPGPDRARASTRPSRSACAARSRSSAGPGRSSRASRMDHGGAGGMARARSKAWIAATQQIPSAEHLGRMRMIAPPMVSGFTVCSPEAIFPGRRRHADPRRIRAGVVAGIAASGAGIGPFVGYPGSEPEQADRRRQPSNGEDLLVHYALGIPYEGQHGDDLERWIDAYGALPGAIPAAGLGMAPAPPARHQDEHRWALALADRAIARGAAARRCGSRVAIVDERGDPIQQDRMDGAPAASVPSPRRSRPPPRPSSVPARSSPSASPDAAAGPDRRRAAVRDPRRRRGAPPFAATARVVAGLGIAGPEPRRLRGARRGRSPAVLSAMPDADLHRRLRRDRRALRRPSRTAARRRGLGVRRLRRARRRDQPRRPAAHRPRRADRRASRRAPIPREIPPLRLGIVATKGTVTEAAIAATAPIFADGAVCSVQNGIGNEEVIAAHVPRVMRGVTLPAGG